MGSLPAGSARWPSIIKNFYTQNCFQHLHAKNPDLSKSARREEPDATGHPLANKSQQCQGGITSVMRHVPIVVTRILTGFIARFHPRRPFYSLYAMASSSLTLYQPRLDVHFHGST